MVNTFLPEPDIHASVKILDYRRLGKQRVETKQILRALRGETKGWVNHPAARMWRGYEGLLVRYGISCCCEWIDRGYQDNLLPYFMGLVLDYDNDDPPWWFGDPAFHYSHRSNLMRKDPEYYGQWYDGIPDDLPYIWPID